MQRDIHEREKRRLEAASDALQTSLEAAAQGDADAAFTMLAHYERDLHEQYDAEDYDTYRGILWAFYEPSAQALAEIAQREGWAFLVALIDAYPRESTADEPLASPVIENAVGRSVIRTRLRDDAEEIPVEALAYLGSFWESMGDVSAEESFTYGWGIGHPAHSVADHLRDALTDEPFWVRGTVPHTFYADQHAAADLFDSLITADRLDAEDRYMLASNLAGTIAAVLRKPLLLGLDSGIGLSIQVGRAGQDADSGRDRRRGVPRGSARGLDVQRSGDVSSV